MRVPRARGRLRALGDDRAVRRHFVAVSTNADGVSAFGIDVAQHVRLLGLGRRPLFHGLGDRSIDHARRRARTFPCDAGWFPRDGRALPHGAVREESPCTDGAARRLVQQCFRGADRRGAAIRSVPQAVPGVSPAADHGEQRQTRQPRRRARRLPDRADLGANRARTASASVCADRFAITEIHAADASG